MIIAKVESDEKFRHRYHKIPAYVENGVLVLGHNVSSEDCEKGQLDSPDKYKAEDFKYFANHVYQGALLGTPHYLYKGKIPYELTESFAESCESSELQYTYLSPCREGTYFCRCENCRRNFVVDCYVTTISKAIGLPVPTHLCKECK